MALVLTTTLTQVAVYGHIVSTGGSSRRVVNVFNYDDRGSTNYAAFTKAALATSFRSAIWNVISQALHVDYVGDDIYVWYASVTGDTPQATGVVPQSGIRAGGRLPVSSAVYVALSSGLRGKNYAGTKRFAGIASGDVAGDRLTPAAEALFQGAANKCAATFTNGVGITFTRHWPIVWSRALSTPPPDVNAQVGADILSADAYKTLSTWRHRREPTQR